MPDHRKDKHMLLLAIAGAVLFMIGDWFIDGFGPGNVEVGIAGNTAWDHMAAWRFTASNILGAIGLPMMLPGTLIWMRIADGVTVTDNKRSVRMNRFFKCGLWAYLISGVFIHIFCGVVGSIYKAATNAGVSSDVAFQIVDVSFYSVLVPFMVYYLLLELGTGIPFWYMVLTGELAIPKVAILCCSLSTLIIVMFMGLTGNYVLHDIFTAGESFGWLLLMAAGIVHLKNEEEKM